ncbi:MAG: PqqD family protein [Actinomycetota bacterium]|nr:PqqD family protein [Actinomycetota bacterium]
MDLLRPDSIDRSFVPRRAGVASVELDGEMVLAGGHDQAFYRLDPVASLVWSCFDGSGTTEEIARDLATELHAPPEVVCEDVLALTRTLAELCFLEGVDCGGGDARPVQPVTLADGTVPRTARRLVEPPSG